MAQRELDTRPGDGVVVRDFDENDRARLRWIFMVARRAAFHWLVDRHYLLTDFDAATDGEAVWVAEIDGEVVGFASIWTQDSFVHNLFVDPAYAGRGAGTALLATLARCYTPPLMLKCLKENRPALRFYRRLGWSVDGDGVGPDGDHYDLSYRP